MNKQNRRALHTLLSGRLPVKPLRQYLESEYMEGDSAVIDVCLYDDLALFDPLSMGRQLDLNPEIYDFIDRKSYLIPAHTPLIIRFHGRALTPEDQACVRDLLSERYMNILRDKLWDLRSLRRKILALLAVGIAFLSLYFYISISLDDGIFLELLSIIASVALWEATGCLLLERSELNRQVLDTLQGLRQRIEFMPD